MPKYRHGPHDLFSGLALVLHCRYCDSYIIINDATDLSGLQSLAGERGWTELEPRWWLWHKCRQINESVDRIGLGARS